MKLINIKKIFLQSNRPSKLEPKLKLSLALLTIFALTFEAQALDIEVNYFCKNADVAITCEHFNEGDRLKVSTLNIKTFKGTNKMARQLNLALDYALIAPYTLPIPDLDGLLEISLTSIFVPLHDAHPNIHQRLSENYKQRLEILVKLAKVIDENKLPKRKFINELYKIAKFDWGPENRQEALLMILYFEGPSANLNTLAKHFVDNDGKSLISASTNYFRTETNPNGVADNKKVAQMILDGNIDHQQLDYDQFKLYNGLAE